jgi:hypothetical protein
MYLSPNFKIDKDENSGIVTPQLNQEGIVDEVMTVEKLGIGAMPITISDDVDTEKIVLATLDSLQTMYLYSNGEIKIER